MSRPSFRALSWFTVAALVGLDLLLTGCPSAPPPVAPGPQQVEDEFFIGAGALQSDGPLRGISFTGHVERENPIIRPTLSFTTQDTEVTAMIGLGDVGEGATLIVTWYRTTGIDGREALFSHEIAVGSGGLAFSQAVAPNGLAAGIYDTAATLDGHVVHTPWIVGEPTGAGTKVIAQAASGDEVGDVPQAGDSWWDEFGGDPPPQQKTSSDSCVVDAFYPGTVLMRDVKVDSAWLGPCTTGTLTATVSGPPTTIASSDTLRGPLDRLRGQTDVCSLSGGSDMPGTVVHFEATGSASGSENFELPDLGESLTAGLEGLPDAGSRVEPGDRIKLHAIALVAPPALGVKTLYVDDGSNLLESVGNLSGRDEPVACDPRRVVAELFSEYLVPADASPLIELCATGVGFDGTEAKSCIHYTAGEPFLGLTGRQLWFRNVTSPLGDEGAYTYDYSRESSSFSLVAVDHIRLEGEACLIVDESLSYFNTPEPVESSSCDPVEWCAHLEGSYQISPDGTIFVEFSATPSESPDITCTRTNFEGTTTTGQASITWSGHSANLVDGRADFRSDSLQPGDSGEYYYEEHMIWTEPP